MINAIGIYNKPGSGGGGSSTPLSSAWGYWEADTKTGTSGSYVLTDKSGNARHMTQQAGTVTFGTAANGQAKATGNATAYFTSAGTIESWPITVITFGRRTAGATCGFFGHTGASPFNSSWFGFESTDRLFQYNTNSTINTDSGGGTDRCWMSMIGYGHRTAAIDGILQSDMTLSTQVRSAAITTSIGTQYRGLNFDWQGTYVWNRVLSLNEVDQMSAYINTKFGKSIPMWSSYTPVNTLMVNGQSNASGRGDKGASNVNIPAQYQGVQTNVNVWYGTPVGFIGSDWSSYDCTGANNHMLGDATNATNFFGMDTSMCKHYKDRVGGDVWLMKTSLGSTSLAYDATFNGYWDPTANTHGQNNQKRLFAQFMTNYWKGLQKLQALGKKYNIVGNAFYQGEQDATVQAYADAYYTNGLAFFPKLREECGMGNFKILLCRIHKDIDGTQPYKNTVRAAQDQLAIDVTNTTLISVDSYTLRDGAHINAAGQLALGESNADLL